MAKIKGLASIKNNLIVYSMSIILLMTVLSLYSLSVMVRYQEQMKGMFEKHIQLSEIEATVSTIDTNLLGFLSTKSSTKLNAYIGNVEKLKELVYEADLRLYNMEDLMQKNIVHLIEEYISQGDKAITYKRQRNVAKYYEHYDSSQKIKAYIFEYIDQLNTKQLNRNSRSYLVLVDQIQLLQTITYVIVTVSILLAVIVVYYLTSRMVKPVGHLSLAAEEISRGNFDTPDIVVESEDEFLILANAFNEMKNSIARYIEEMMIKAETERELKDEQMKNIRMEHLLDNAKLYALQSQINPHFLFNTINAAVHMSIMERAGRTGEFLETMARLFRYHIKKMEESSTLEEEVQNIQDYYELLKARFGSRIQFQFQIDPATLQLRVPPLILQPIVENAYIHGLSPLEEGGSITLTTVKAKEKTYIIIKDSGKGMSEDMISRILDRNPGEDEIGIGVRNVRDRLELFYHCKELFQIISREKMGTKIVITIPEKALTKEESVCSDY